MEAGEGVDFVADLEKGPLSQTFSHIECVSVLEHVQRPWKMAANLEAMLDPGGSIFLSVPWVWKFHAYPHDYFRFSHMSFPILFPSIQWRAIRYGVKDALTENPRMPKSVDGSLTKMEVLGFGVKA